MPAARSKWIRLPVRCDLARRQFEGALSPSCNQLLERASDVCYFGAEVSLTPIPVEPKEFRCSVMKASSHRDRYRRERPNGTERRKKGIGAALSPSTAR